jgi:glycosyltransferase involved in cell wall biosynthesis
MRVLHVAPTAMSNISAAWRIRDAQRQIGIDAIAAVQIGENLDHVYTFDQNKSLALIKKRFFARLDSLPIRISTKRNHNLPWSSGWAGPNISTFINNLSPDIVNFHWLTNGLLNLKDLKHINCPVVFTMHDVWPITGGCHCNLDCDNWLRGCHECPQLGKSLMGIELASLMRERKIKAYSQISNLSIVTPSRWLGEMVKKSGCFPDSNIEIIQNCLDLGVFKKGCKKDARQNLGLPLDKIILGFGAVNATDVPYKGYDLLKNVMDILYRRGIENLHLVIFGSNQDGSVFPFDVSFLGAKDCEEDLSAIYKSCDIFLSPSRQDNFPSTVMEATACATPVVAFNVGGVSDLIKHKVSGYLSDPFDINDFADGIEWIISSTERLSSMGQSAYEFTSHYCDPTFVAKKYHDLYKSLILDLK